MHHHGWMDDVLTELFFSLGSCSLVNLPIADGSKSVPGVLNLPRGGGGGVVSQLGGRLLTFFHNRLVWFSIFFKLKNRASSHSFSFLKKKLYPVQFLFSFLYAQLVLSELVLNSFRLVAYIKSVL
jgi:hypothetical protein